MNSALHTPQSAFKMARLRQSILQKAFNGKFMSTPFNMDEPDEWEKDYLRQLRELHKSLKNKHARRRRSPLIFVETYAFTALQARRFYRSGWDSVEKELASLKNFLARLEPDYKHCLGPAEAQQKRNVVWEQIHHPPPRFLEGGRVDGNGS